MNASKFLFVAVLIALSACSSQKQPDKVTVGTSTTEKTDAGSVTTTTGTSMTVNSGHGTITTGKDVDTSKLGAPVYPGASSDSATTVSGAGDGNNGMLAAFKTKDDFDKVYQFYKSNLPNGSEKLKTEAGGESAAMFSVENDSGTTNVQIASKDGETTILITHQGK